MPQDMPPTGGYEPVQYRRNLPARGFRPAWYLAAVAGIMTYGFYRIGQGIREHKYVSHKRSNACRGRPSRFRREDVVTCTIQQLAIGLGSDTRRYIIGS